MNPVEQFNAYRSVVDMESVTKRTLLEALTQSNGNRKIAAKLMGVAYPTILKWVDRFDIKRPKGTYRKKSNVFDELPESGTNKTIDTPIE